MVPRRRLTEYDRDVSTIPARSRHPVDNPALLLWGILFSSIGLGFFIYGKKQGSIPPLISGIALMIYPYFVSSTVALVAIGVVLMAAPYFFRL
jgi:hypothetical protein